MVSASQNHLSHTVGTASVDASVEASVDSVVVLRRLVLEAVVLSVVEDVSSKITPMAAFIGDDVVVLGGAVTGSGGVHHVTFPDLVGAVLTLVVTAVVVLVAAPATATCGKPPPPRLDPPGRIIIVMELRLPFTDPFTPVVFAWASTRSGWNVVDSVGTVTAFAVVVRLRLVETVSAGTVAVSVSMLSVVSSYSASVVSGVVSGTSVSASVVSVSVTSSTMEVPVVVAAVVVLREPFTGSAGVHHVTFPALEDALLVFVVTVVAEVVVPTAVGNKLPLGRLDLPGIILMVMELPPPLTLPLTPIPFTAGFCAEGGDAVLVVVVRLLRVRVLVAVVPVLAVVVSVELSSLAISVVEETSAMPGRLTTLSDADPFAAGSGDSEGLSVIGSGSTVFSSLDTATEGVAAVVRRLKRMAASDVCVRSPNLTISSTPTVPPAGWPKNVNGVIQELSYPFVGKNGDVT